MSDNKIPRCTRTISEERLHAPERAQLPKATDLSSSSLHTRQTCVQVEQLLLNLSLDAQRRVARTAEPNLPLKKKKKKKKKQVLTPNRNPKITPSIASGGVPCVTTEYMIVSESRPLILARPQPLLVVIDLNGTILYRPQRKDPTHVIQRPLAERFLQYCVDKFSVVIWSSARPQNVEHICRAILPPDVHRRVVAIWGRDRFGLSKHDFNTRVVCYKRLTTLWADAKISSAHPDYATGARWDQTNTVLIDDSVEKGTSEPFNLLQIPEFCGDEMESNAILPKVHDYLNYLSMHSNVSACLRKRSFINHMAASDATD